MIPTNGSRPLLSIIIPARDEEAYLPAALGSVRAALDHCCSRIPDPATVEVIVSDNLSTDRTAEIARAAGARVVEAPRRNIASVRNCGARAARGKFLLFLDADSLLHPRQIRRVVSLLSRPDVIGGGAPCSVDDRSPDVLAIQLFMNASARLFGTAFGSFMFCRREDLREIGGFDERADAGEELIFSEAMHKLGRRRGQRFRIITECPVHTSMRKLRVHGRGKLYRVLVSLFWDVLHHRPIQDRHNFWYPPG